MSDAPPVPRLVPLKCPRCQSPLPARPGEVLFFCPKCPTAVEGADGALAPLPLHFEAGDRPWWWLVGQAQVRQFAATRSARTTFGTVERAGQKLPVRFLIPADARPIHETYRAALDAAGSAHSEGARPASAVKGGVYGRRAAEQIARQIFLTLVARADGKIHHIEFALELPDASIVVRKV
jgi:hypothetical protein